MNCNLYNTSHPYSILLHDLMSRYSLFSAFDKLNGFDPCTHYTRSDPKTNSYTLIDGILLSKSLSSRVTDVRIVESGDNVSDHLPVEIDISLNLGVMIPVSKKPRPFINWSKLSTNDLLNFLHVMTQELDRMSVPFYTIIHGDKCCSDASHRSHIESYFQDIRNAVLIADSCLPRSLPTFQKSYWSPDLSDLKQKSLDCFRFWRAHGAPKCGPIFRCKVICSSRYKKAIREAKRNFDKNVSDEMHLGLTSLDTDSFWKAWRNRNNQNDSAVTRVNGEVTGKGIADAFGNHF